MNLEGIWRPVSAQLDGEDAPALLLAQMEIELAEGRYRVRFGGAISDEGTYALDEAGLTLTGVHGPNAGRRIPCAYKFEEETLWICYGLGDARPAEFTTSAGSQRYLVAYRRPGAG